MPAPKIVDFFDDDYEDALIEATSVEQVNAVFDKLNDLSAKDRKSIVRGIEESFVEDLIEMTEDVKKTLISLPEGTSVSFEIDGDRDAAVVAETLFQTLARIAGVRGNAAHPFTRAFAEEAKKLSADERKSFEALTMTSVKAYNAVMPPPPVEDFEDALRDATEDGDLNLINALFRELKAYGEKNAQRIAGALEKPFVRDFKDLAQEAKSYLKAAPENSLESFVAEEATDDPETVQAVFHGFDQLAEVRGEAANPLTRAFTKAAKKLSAEERQSTVQLIATVVEAYDTAFLPKPSARVQNKGPKGPGA